MSKQLLFIQGGGNNGYETDQALVASLQKELGPAYEIIYPKIQNDETAADFGWVQQIAGNIATMKEDFVLLGHSFGASMILKLFSEQVIVKEIAGIFLLSTPFWTGDAAWIKGLKLQENFAEKLPKNIPVFFYHCQDDDEVPFAHLSLYKEKLTGAIFREIVLGGHQLDNHLTLVAQDIKSLDT